MAELISISGDRKVIVDTNIPLEIFVDRFFDRNDPEKKFILSVIESCENPEAVMNNYKRGLALIKSKKHYDEYAESGFFTVKIKLVEIEETLI